MVVDETTYGVASAETIRSYDGLGFLKAMIAGVVPQAPMCELLGMRLIEAEDGHAVFEGNPTAEH